MPELAEITQASGGCMEAQVDDNPSAGPGRTQVHALDYSQVTLAAEGVARRPIWELLFLALPTIAQMASYTVMQFGDTWMLAVLGVKEPTAAGNAGIFAFSIIGFGWGVLMCVNTLV